MRSKAVPIGQLDTPAILYKYRDYENSYHRLILEKGEIYLPSVNEFNDPQDCNLPFRYREKELTEENIFRKCLEISRRAYPSFTEEEHHERAYREQRARSIFDEHHLEQYDADLYRSICNTYGLYCLTQDETNFLMWSYYSNSHKGFCVGFNTEKLIRLKLFSLGGKVLYKNQFPKIPLFNNEDSFFLNIFFTKSKVWKHENEYRLLHKFKTGKSHAIPIDIIEEVILGANFPEKDILGFTKQLTQILPHTKIFKMELNKTSFGLVKKTVFDSNLFLF